MADCGKGCAKCMLILFNVIFLLTGLALFAVGLWVRFDDKIWSKLGFVSLDTEDPYIEYGAYLLIAIGGFIIITSVLGCCGAITEKKFCLSLYIFILVIVLLAEVAGGVLIILYQNRIKDTFTVNALKLFQDPEKNYYNTSRNGWSAFASTMNILQQEFECCGISSPADYELAPANVKTCGTQPCSCFMKYPNSTQKVESDLAVTDVNVTATFPIGCETKILDFFEKYSVIFIGLAIGFACLEVFGLIYSICLCQLAGRSSKYTE